MQHEHIEIPLRTRDGSVKAVALIDAADAHLAELRWCMISHGYVGRKVTVDRGRQTTLFLHRAVLGLEPGDGLEGDHVNRDKLDNRRANLRVLSRASNSQNRGCHGNRGNRTSAHRGVSWVTRDKKWRADCTVAGVRYFIGYFDEELAAAEAVQQERLLRMPFTVERS